MNVVKVEVVTLVDVSKGQGKVLYIIAVDVIVEITKNVVLVKINVML